MKPMTENSKKVFNYVKDHAGEVIIAANIAEATGLGVRQVNGVLTSLSNKELIKRVAFEIEQEDGTHKPAKKIVLTETGKTFDPEAVEVATAE